MVRETRHLWIGNLPENVREEQIRELFQRHGRVQSVKFLPDESGVPSNAGSTGGRPGKCATVAFIDIRSATKALRAVHSMGGQPLQITYHEPGSVPSRALSVTENSSPGDNISSTPTVECGTNPASTGASGNSVPNVASSGVTNGPTATPAGPGLYRRFPLQHGQSDDSSSHFYEQPKSFSRGRGDGHGFHGGRGRREHRHMYHSNRLNFPSDRNYRVPWGYPNDGRYAPSAHSEVDERPQGPPSSHTPQNETSSKATRRPDSPASSVSSRHLHSKRHKSRSVSESGSSDRGSSGGSRSRSGSRSSVSTSVSSARSRSPPHHTSSGHYSSSRGGSPGNRFHQNSYSRRRYSRSRLVSSRLNDSTRTRHSSRSPHMPASPTSSESSSPSPHRKLITTPHSPSHSPSSAKSYSPSRSINQSGHHHNHHHNQRRKLNSSELQSAIRIRNLPTRSTDTSLKDGLYHEYKKHGKVSSVKVIGTGSDRYAIVCFKSSEHANRAVESSQDKQFFGCKIQVSRFYSNRGDEGSGINDEDSRGLSEDEFASVSIPTRTVLITGLDTNITYAELKAELGQCGDIVSLRMKGTSTDAICEFVDIASAIRAQWVRHICKSREARVSFVRTAPSATLLLDGTEGFSEKSITGRCSQYGAISRVISDIERNLTLVQFDEISSAQTAIREIRSWSIKGKHIHVDFTSPECVRLFLERINGSGRGTVADNLPSSNHRSLSSSSYVDIPSGKDSARRISRRNNSDLDFESSKPLTHLRLLDESGSPESASGCILREGKGVMSLISGDVENGLCSARIYRRPDIYSSSLSPDTERSGLVDDSVSGIRTGKVEHCKIDLNCHETDSAVVTSSSDVISAEVDAHEANENTTNHGISKHNKYEFSRVNSTASKSAIVAVAVDGVSSTSPEPKVETVRKASPDPGLGLPILETSGKAGDSSVVTTGLVDPRKKPNENKIRRSSADSGSNTTSSTMYTNGSEGGEESDDRPGTPLCDENPESFFANENNNVSVKVSSRHVTNLNKLEQPLSLPLPGFALQRFPHYSSGSRNGTVGAIVCNESKLINRRLSETIISKSPIKSPQYEGSGSVMNSSTSDCETISPSAYVDSKVSASDRHTDAILAPSKSTNVVNWHDSDVSDLNSHSDGREQPVSNYSIERSASVDSADELKSPCAATTEDNSGNVCVVADCIPTNDKNAVAASSSDSESGSSPRSSPTEKSLDERLSLFHDKYNQWEGNRTSARTAVPLHRSSNLGDACSRTTVSTTISSSPALGDSSEVSSLTRFPRIKHKVLDLDEMRHQPSDIVKSLLAKKSVFDEDTKRLENFGEKYEAKCAPPIPGNWRMALGRTPTSPVTPVTPTCNSTATVVSPTAKPSSPTHSVTVFQSPTTTTPLGPTTRIVNTSHQGVGAKIQSQQSVTPSVSKSCVKELNSISPCTNTMWTSAAVKPSEKSVSIEPSAKMSTVSDSKLTIETGVKTIPTSPVTNSFRKTVSETLSGVSIHRSTTSNKSASTVCANMSPSENAVSQSTNSASVPRVERSVSLDCKRAATSGAQVTSSASCSPTTASSLSPVSTTCSPNQVTQRRVSADSRSTLGASKDASNTKKSTQPPVLEPARKCVKETPTTLTKDHIAKVVHAKDELSSKGVSIIKTEPSVVHHGNHPSETTVAVVASVQSPMVLSKDTKRDSRDKKRRNSGTSTPTISAATTPTSSSSRGDSTSGSAQKPCSSSSRDKKEKDCKRVNNDESVTTPTCNLAVAPDQNVNNHHHNKNKSKEKAKDEKEHRTSESSTGSGVSASTKDTHSHRKDKDFNKLKRRLSSQEREQVESKKCKVEKKEPTTVVKDFADQMPTNHSSGKSKHSASSSSSIERRESRDSSSSQKDKTKEVKVERDSAKSNESSNSSSKDHHHKLKISSSSTSSNSKHHHSNDKKASSENYNSSSHSHKSSSDSTRRKDKSSSKDSSKTKHSSGSNHSHAHHGSASSGSNKKESSSKGKVSSWKDKEVKSKDKPFDSDDEHDLSIAIPAHEKDKGREKSKDRSEKHDKREEISKRDRHKSGDSSSAPNSAETKRARTKQEKKKKRSRIIADDTESSDSGKSGDEDEDDKQKHHSIFEVVIDEYPSMYDKVKTSNRRCKNNASAQQQQEEQRKQEKLKEQFQQLKQSRAKREEKKRSTSIEERKSYINSSSDESNAGQHQDSDNANRSYPRTERERERHLSRVQETADEPTTDEDEPARASKSDMQHKNKDRSKSKNRSSKNGQSSKHKGKKLTKSSPTSASTFPSSSSIFYSHSDEDSRHSSPPATKKRKVKHQPLSSSTTSNISHQSVDTKSSDDSVSDFDDSNVIMSNVTKPSLSAKLKYASSSKAKKLSLAEIYTDSDSSVRSGRGMKNTLQSTKLKSSREKALAKQKSVDLNKLFDDTSESSEDEEANTVTSKRRDKDGKDEAPKQTKDKERDQKESFGRKKSLSSSSSKSSSKGQRRRLSSEEIVSDVHHKLNSSAMKDVLFGSTSGSELDEKPAMEERPKTPTPVIIPAKPSYEETPVSTKSKVKLSRKQRSGLHPLSHENSGSYEEDSMDTTVQVTPVTSSSSKSEKKRRRHHKEKKSKRSEGPEVAVSSSVQPSYSGITDPVKVKTEVVDVDSLFNSPQSSPRDVRTNHCLPANTKPIEPAALTVDVSSTIFGTANSQRSPLFDAMKPKTIPKDYGGDDSGSKSMFSFSTDEDEDDLKIDINAAIMASSDQPDDIEASSKPEDVEHNLMAEEEEKKLHCLFEQDKAIESIVLLDRRSPPRALAEDESNIKDEIPKEEVAISQEETEDAVADLLDTLGRDDLKSEDDEADLGTKASTIRLAAETPLRADEMEVGCEPSVTDEAKSENWSPKNMHMDEIIKTKDLLPSSDDNPQPSSGKLSAELQRPKTAEASTEVLKCFTLPEAQSESNADDKTGKDGLPETKENASDSGVPSTLSTDVYEFTDSDDEKHEETQPLAHCKTITAGSTSKSPTTIIHPIALEVVDPPKVNPEVTISAQKSEPVVPAIIHGTGASLSSIIGTSPPQAGPAGTPPSEMSRMTHATPLTTPSNTPTGIAGKVSPVAQSTRTTVDDTIDDVIRMAQTNTLCDLEIAPKAATASNRSRSRSHSKDTPEDTVASHIAVLNAACGSSGKNSLLTIEATSRRTDSSMFATPGISPVIISTSEYPPLRREVEKDPDVAQESLVDPQTGILTPMRRQSGEYVPVQNNADAGTENLMGHHLQVSLRTSEIISKAMEQRSSVLESYPQQHPQLVTTNKAEGLPAILAQQQHHGPPTKTAVIQQQHSPQAQHARPPSMGSQVGQYQKGVISHASIPKGAIIYTSQGQFPVSKASLAQTLPVSSPVPPVSSPVSCLAMYSGKATISPAPNSAQKPPNQTAHQQSNNTPYVTLIRSVDHSPTLQQRPSHTAPARSNQNFPSHVVRIPEVPSSTQVTITKVNPADDQQRKSAIVQHGNVLVTSTAVSSPHASNASMSRVVPPAHSVLHHSQPITSQAELMRIGCPVNKEDPTAANFRPNELYTSSQPNSASLVLAASPSPKSSRNGQTMDSMPTQMAARNYASHHTITFDSSMGESMNYPRQHSETSHYLQSQANHSQQPVYPGHYTPVSMPNSSVGNVVQVQTTGLYGMRKAHVESVTQQQQKRGTPESHAPKGGATLTLIPSDRGVPQGVHIPPHLASPHQTDQRSSESPSIATVYNQRIYGAPMAHHQQPRPTFPNPYAELDERPYSSSPSFHQYDQRVAALDRDREREIVREASPYSMNVMTRRGGTPPPAHIRYSMHGPMSSELPSPTGRSGPLHLISDSHGDHSSHSDAPPLLTLLQRYPIMWQGLLALKNDSAACQMHFVSGNANVARDSLPTPPDGTIPPLRISQRMRLEQTQLEGVARKMQMEPEYCMLLALPCGRDEVDVLQQSNNLRNGFITYLQLKQAAGIVNISHPISQQPAYVIHIFPSCDFANEKLANIAPDLLSGVADIAHLLIIIATV